MSRRRPTIINGQRVVRVRKRRRPLGPLALLFWIVTDAHGFAPLGPNHLDAAAARTWAERQGWRVLG